MSIRHRSRGFSLLEAVVALALLALALPVILSAFGDAVSRAARAEHRIDALRRAQDLVTLATARFNGQKVTRSGSDANATWNMDVEPFDSRRGERRRESSDPVPVQLTVTVRSKHGDEVRLDTLFLFQEVPQ